MSRINKSVSFSDNLLTTNIVEESPIVAPLASSETKLSETKSRIPVRRPAIKIKPCLLEPNPKLTIKTKRDPVTKTKISIKKPTKICEGSTSTVEESKSSTCLVKEQNAQTAFKNRVPRATTKFQHLCRTCKYHYVSTPRAHMPLVVIDFDVMILKLTRENILSMKESVLDFLTELYPYYNIAMWSSLNMIHFVKQLEDHKIFQQSFKVCFCLDQSSLISAFVPSVGITKVKSLQVVWTLYPQFQQKNSVLIDEGLKNIVFKHYRVAAGGPSKGVTPIEEAHVCLLSKYLVWYFRTGKEFSKLNQPTWKLSWNEKF